MRDVHTKDNKATFATRHTNHPSGQIPTTRPHRYSGNLELWARKGYSGARLIQGDSRELGKVLENADCIVSSPPYAGNVKSDYLLSDDGKTRARDVKRGYKQGHGCFRGSETYGQTPGQLGSLATGSVEACISSPPYANGCTHTGGTDPQPQHIQGGPLQYVAYGKEHAQLGNLAPGNVQAVIGSGERQNVTERLGLPTGVAAVWGRLVLHPSPPVSRSPPG